MTMEAAPAAPLPSPPAFVKRFLPYRRHADWLDEATVDALLAYAADNQTQFKPSKIREEQGENKVAPERRFSLRLVDLGPFQTLLRGRALGALAETCAALGTAPFDPRGVEVELVAHGDGAHFVRHRDTYAPPLDGAPRRVTMVCYLHRRPKAFFGGALRYYTLDGDDFIDIEPACGEMVAFPSWAFHSVEPVSVPGDAFADRRFAVNMWIKG